MDYTEAIVFVTTHGLEPLQEDRIVEAVYFKSHGNFFPLRYETRTSFAVKEMQDMYAFQDCLYYTVINGTVFPSFRLDKQSIEIHYRK